MKKLIQLAMMLLWLSSCKVAELRYMDNLGRQVVLHTDSTLVKANLQKQGLLVLPSIQYTYYWFEKGKISSSQGAYSGKVLHGQYRVYDRESKQLMESGKFYKGLKNGRWLIWNTTGMLSRSEIYKAGQLNGMLVKYDSLGRAADTLKYRRGHLLPERIKAASDTTGLFRRVKRFLGLRK
jgi:hypothetical protein